MGVPERGVPEPGSQSWGPRAGVPRVGPRAEVPEPGSRGWSQSGGPKAGVPERGSQSRGPRAGVPEPGSQSQEQDLRCASNCLWASVSPLKGLGELWALGDLDSWGVSSGLGHQPEGQLPPTIGEGNLTAGWESGVTASKDVDFAKTKRHPGPPPG